MMLFDTLDEAQDVNSDCVFCGKPKFLIAKSKNPRNTEKIVYSLERCPDPECSKHCHFNHTMSIQIPDGREDTVEIASGWGSS